MVLDQNKKEDGSPYLHNALKNTISEENELASTSYEGLSSANRQKTSPKRMKKKKPFSRVPKWVYSVIIVLLAVVVGLFIWFGVAGSSDIGQWLRSITVGVGNGNGYPTDIVGSTVSRGNFITMHKNAVALSDTALTVMNNTAKHLVNCQHGFSHPVLQASNGRYLLYNLGGSGFKVVSDAGNVYESNADSNLITGHIADNGRYVLVTEKKGYLSSLSVYLTNHSVQYKYDFSEYYVTDVSLNHDGTRAAVSAMTAKDGGLVSAVYIFDLSIPTPIAVLTYSEALIEQVIYLQDGTVAAVGDTVTSMINGTTGEKVDYSYQSRRMTDFAVDSDRVALVLTPFDNQSANKIVLLNSRVAEQIVIESYDSIDAVSLYRDTVATLTNDTITGYSASSGNAFSTANAGSDARGIALADEAHIYVLGVSQVRLSKFS